MHQGFFKVGFDLYDEPYWAGRNSLTELRKGSQRGSVLTMVPVQKSLLTCVESRWRVCYQRGLPRLVLVPLCIAFLEEREYVERLVRMKNGLVSTFPFHHTSKAEKPQLSFPITTKAS